MANFDSKNEGTFFPYVDDDLSQGGVCLRELTSDESIRIEKITTKIKHKVKRGTPIEEKTRDEKTYTRLLWDFCIVFWEKTSLDGEELECTTDNKVKMINVIDFAKFVSDKLVELVDSNKSLEEARVKNLTPLSDGK